MCPSARAARTRPPGPAGHGAKEIGWNQRTPDGPPNGARITETARMTGTVTNSDRCRRQDSRPDGPRDARRERGRNCGPGSAPHRPARFQNATALTAACSGDRRQQRARPRPRHLDCARRDMDASAARPSEHVELKVDGQRAGWLTARQAYAWGVALRNAALAVDPDAGDAVRDD